MNLEVVSVYGSIALMAVDFFMLHILRFTTYIIKTSYCFL